MPFDPFSDRTARDIRNTLSSALILELSGAGAPTVAAVAGQWLARQPGAVYQAYIEGRQRQYRDLLTRIRAEGINGPRHQSIILWNDGLFFELHELLETIWHGAVATERTGLKGLIQAAGAYLHSLRGKGEIAQKLARRARMHLRTGAAGLSFIANLEQLIVALADSPPAPLQLVYQS